MSAAVEPGPVDPTTVDALLGVLVRHARDLAATGVGPIRVAAGALSVELGETTSSGPVAEDPAARPTLAAVPPVAPAPEVPTAPPPGPTVCSGTVGVFYRASEPGSAPFVSEGDSVSAGQQIGIVEAMKLMIPLESDRAGRVAEFLVADGDSVEHGQPVLRLTDA